MQAFVQLLAQTRDNLQYLWDNAFIAWQPKCRLNLRMRNMRLLYQPEECVATKLSSPS